MKESLGPSRKGSNRERMGFLTKVVETLYYYYTTTV